MTQTPSLKTQTWQVGGMDCGSCAKTIEASLQQLRGITEAKVTFATGKVQFSYETESVSEKNICDRIKSLGYTVEQTPQVSSHHHTDSCAHHNHDHDHDHDHDHADITPSPTQNTVPNWKL